jgi:restriction system protein
MANEVACLACKTILSEKSDTPPEKRLPCPNCGSMARAYSITASGALFSITGSAELRLIKGIDILLQAVVVLGNKTEEGSIIGAVTPAWQEIVRMLSSDPNIAFKIDPRKWEEIIAVSYEKAGFDEVILTPRSGDFGRDVIAVKKGRYSVRFIDQVKAYKPGNMVTANDIRAMIGVLLTDTHATKGVVTTTSSFATKVRDDPSIKPYLPYRLELIDGKELVTKLSSLL